MQEVQLFFLVLCLSSSKPNPLGIDEIPNRPPLIWHLLGGVLKGVLDPLDRGLPQDVCGTFCDLPKPVKTGLAAAACGGALLTKSWTGIVCPLSMVSWGSALDPSLCSDLCSAGQQIPRAAFDLTGVYLDPATAAAVTGLLYLLNSGQEANLYVAGTGELLQLNPGKNNRKVLIFDRLKRNADFCCVNFKDWKKKSCKDVQLAGLAWEPQDISSQDISFMDAFTPNSENVDAICGMYYAVPDADNKGLHSEEKILERLKSSDFGGATNLNIYLWTYNSPCTGEIPRASDKKIRIPGSCSEDIFKYTLENAIPSGHKVNVGFSIWYPIRGTKFIPKRSMSEVRQLFCELVDTEKIKNVRFKVFLSFTKIKDQDGDLQYNPQTATNSGC